MKYIGMLNDGVIVAKAKNHDDKVYKNEIELTEKQYNSIPIPCKLVNGEFVRCEFPKSEIEDVTYEEPITEMEQLRADVDYIAVMTGVEL